MMEPNCGLISKLCLTLYKCTTSGLSNVQKLQIIEQLLDLILNLVTGDVADPEQEKLKGLQLERSRLNVGSLANLISHEGNKNCILGNKLICVGEIYINK